MSELVLNAEKRESFSKGISRGLRREGRVPAIYYMHGEVPVALSVDAKEFKKILHADSSIVDVALSPKKKLKTVIRDIQWHPVTGYPLHVDFMGVKMTEKVTVDVTIHLTGTATGVKNGGGLLQQQLREISVECLPADIPEHLEVDVSELDLNQSVLVGDLELGNVKVLNELDQSIVSVRPSTLVAEEDEDVEAVVEPELIGKSDSKDSE